MGKDMNLSRAVDLNHLNRNASLVRIGKEYTIQQYRPMRWYFRKDKFTVETEDGLKSEVEMIYCDEFSRFPKSCPFKITDLKSMIQVLNIVLKSNSILILQSVVNSWIKYDLEFYDYFQNNYSGYWVKLPEDIFNRQGLYLPSQLSREESLKKALPSNNEMIDDLAMNTRIAKNVKAERERQGLTIKELAEDSDLKEKTVRNVENPDLSNYVHTLEKIAKGLDVSLFELLI
jgi:DNA-binding XRE family transcriptional regulator